jgi:hypothetical protein
MPAPQTLAPDELEPTLTGGVMPLNVAEACHTGNDAPATTGVTHTELTAHAGCQSMDGCSPRPTDTARASGQACGDVASAWPHALAKICAVITKARRENESLVICGPVRRAVMLRRAPQLGQEPGEALFAELLDQCKSYPVHLPSVDTNGQP